MTIRNLDALLNPRSVAVIGASDRAHSVGATVMRNLLAGGFAGMVYPVNQQHREVAGRAAFARVADLPAIPDLAVICTPAPSVPSLITELGALGTRAAVVLSAGLNAPAMNSSRTLSEAMLEAAKPNLLRILGPNCVGLILPGIGLNASFAHVNALPGKLAFVTQSGALLTTMLDWARSRGIGFSGLVSVGERADVDFGDLIDYYGSDADTRAILLYIESIKTARKFLSASRAAARNKPVIVVKSGRAPEGARAAASHSGALAGSDDVFDAAIRRAGMLRVDTLAQLYDAVQTLSHRHAVSGERLAIMTNGGGAGVLAADWNSTCGGRLADLSPKTIAQLDQSLPPIWSKANPVDIIGDAPTERYVKTLQTLIDEPNADAILFMHAPTAIVASEKIALACAPVAKSTPKMVLSCWLGDESVSAARKIFHEADIASYGTPEEAIQAFHQLLNYRRNQALLMQTPRSVAAELAVDQPLVRRVFQEARASGQVMLSEIQAKRVLAAYGIPVAQTRQVNTANQAIDAAKQIGFPVALKILSPDITHKSDAGGVTLNIETEDELKLAITSMGARVARLAPAARQTGFTVQAMVRRPNAHEVLVGVASDPLFGPVILFGQGGTAVEVTADRAIGLPPLNMPLASELVSQTRVAKLLAGYRNRAAAKLEDLHLTLVRVSQLVVDCESIAELDINPLLVDDQGVIALDARVRLTPPDPDTARGERDSSERLAIRPYPSALEESVQWRGKRLQLRPIRPEDEALHLELLSRLSPEDVRMRIFYSKRVISRSEMARLTQIDYEREMAFIALATDAKGREESLGVVRVVATPNREEAEFAIVVRSDLKGQGLGRLLLEKMIRYCRNRGIGLLVGNVLLENHAMLALAESLGFESRPSNEASQALLCLALDSRGLR